MVHLHVKYETPTGFHPQDNGSAMFSQFDLDDPDGLSPPQKTRSTIVYSVKDIYTPSIRSTNITFLEIYNILTSRVSHTRQPEDSLAYTTTINQNMLLYFHADITETIFMKMCLITLPTECCLQAADNL